MWVGPDMEGPRRPYFPRSPHPRLLLLLLFAGFVLPLAAADPDGGPAWQSAVKNAATQHARDTLNQALSDNTVVIFSKAQCSASRRVKSYFEDEGIPYYALELDTRNDGDALKGALHEHAGSSKTPKVYIRGQLVEYSRAMKSGELRHWADEPEPT